LNGNNFASSNLNIYKDSTTLKIDLINFEYKRLNGNYNLYICSIGKNRDSHFLKIIVDSKNTYIETIRHNLKHHNSLKDINIE